MRSGAGPDTFTVTYDPNGAAGTVPRDGNQYESGSCATVLGGGNLVKAGEDFANWNTAPDGKGDGYGGDGPGKLPIGFADVTLYAQWFTTAGLTRDPQGREGRTAHYQFSYDSSLQKTAANPGGIEPDRTNALIAACEGDFAILQNWFGGMQLGAPAIVPIHVQVANLPDGALWHPDTFYCTLKPVDKYKLRDAAPQLLYLRFMLVAEVAEMFMLVQGKGWFPPSGGTSERPNTEGSAGEGLSRFLGQQFLLAIGADLSILRPSDLALRWLDSALEPPIYTYSDYDYGARADYVNNTLPWDSGNDPATGCAILFLYYLLTQLGFSVASIVAAGAATLADVYHNLTADPGDPYFFFYGLLAEAYPPGKPAAAPLPNRDNPWPLGASPPRPLLMACTGPNGLNSITEFVSVNDWGSVAFVGTGERGRGLFVADGVFSAGGRSQPRNINPTFTSDQARMFGDFVQINNAGMVLATDEVPGAPSRTFLRTWNSRSPDAYVDISSGGGQYDRFNAVMSPPSFSKSDGSTDGSPETVAGKVTFPALKGAATCLATPTADTPASGIMRPRIASTGRIVVKGGWQAGSPVRVYDYGLDTDPADIAASPYFSATGGSPGISAHGQAVAFYGELSQAGADQLGLPAGPGIFAAISADSGWTIHRVAGTGGDDPAGLVPQAPVCVNSTRMFTYLGTDADGNQGVYMTRLSFFSAEPDKLVFRPVAPPTLLAAAGAPLPLAEGLSLDVLQYVGIYDALNDHGDVAFWVQTVGGLQAVVLMPRGSGSDYRDPAHATYINAYDAGFADAPYPAGLPRARSDGQRGGDACGAAALTMLLNAMQYATDLNLPDLRWRLMSVYCATADKPIGDPAAPPDGNNFNWLKGQSYARYYGWGSARYISGGKDAIDAQLAKHVPVMVSTRFGAGPNWSKGHCVLLLSRTAGGQDGRDGFYIVDDPAGYVSQTGAGRYGHYGRGQCGEHVIYPEPLVAQALVYPDNTPRSALVLDPAPGQDPDVLLVTGQFDGPGPPPYQLWLQDAAGRQTGWLPGGAQVTDIPASDAGMVPAVASDPSAVPDVSPDRGSWPFAVSVANPEDGISVFVSGNLQADFSLEALRYTATGVIRSVTTGTVLAGETQQVMLAAPAMRQLTLNTGPGGTSSVSPAASPYPDGTEVTLTAMPAPDYVFSGWTIDDADGGTDQPLVLLMDTDHTVSAGFTAATVRSITIRPARATVPVGENAPFLAAVTYSDGSTGDLTPSVAWSVSDTKTATVSNAGLCTGRQAGQVTVTAALGSLTATAALTVSVTPVLTSINVSPASRSIAIGGSGQFTATGTWSDGSTGDLTGTADWASDSTVVSFAAPGIVTAGQQADSVATVTATRGAISGSATVSVVAPPAITAIEVVPLGAGIQQFRAIGIYSDHSTDDITGIAAWTTSDGQVASVTGPGQVTSVAAGPVTVNATMAGVTGAASLQAAPPALLTIMVSPSGATITPGAHLSFTATGVMSDGTARDLTATAFWSSQNASAATVTYQGIASGTGPGGTVITATQAGLGGSAGLTVTAAPVLQAVAVIPARPAIAAGASVQFRATGVYDDGSTQDLTSAATWSSGTAAVAAFPASGPPGLATGGTAGGVTQVTATAGGFAGATSLTVTAAPVLRSIAVTPAAPSVPAGETVQFTATGTYTDGSSGDITAAVNWGSTDSGVATVSGGLARAVAQGTVSITATDGTISGAASLTVPPPVTIVSWTGPGSGSWQDAANWSGGQVPGPSHDVIINGPAGTVVTYAEATTAVHSLNCQNDLAMEGGSLTLGASSVIAGALTMSGAAELGYGADVLVSGLFTCEYGQLSGPGTITAADVLALSGENLLISGGTLVNAGHASWTSGNIVLEQDAAIVNGPGAVFDVRVDRAMTYQGRQVAVFTNNGTFRKSAGPGTASLYAITFDNAGAVELDSGTLSFEPDFSLPGSLATWTGTVTGADGTTLILTGPLVLQEGSSLSVPSVVFNGGPVTIAGQYQASVSTSTTTGAPAVSFTGSARVDSTGTVTIDSGTIAFATGAPVTLAGLTLSTGGELAGSDDVLVSGMFTVTYGMLSGPGTVTAGGGLAIAAAGGQLQVSGCTLVNTGYASWTGGNISVGMGGVIENRAGARFEVPADQFAQARAFMFSETADGSAVFSNAGTFHVPAGTVSLTSVALDNAGVIRVDGGTLFLQPRQVRPAIWTGSFDGRPGSTLALAGPHELRATSSLSGPAVQFASPFGPVHIAGRYAVTGSTSATLSSGEVFFTTGAAVTSTGTVSIESGTISFGAGAPVTLPSLALSGGGRLAALDPVTISGPFATIGGRLTGPGPVTANGGVSFSGNEGFLLSGCTLVNNGAASWSGGIINADDGAVFSNTAGSTFDVSCDGLFYWCGQGDSSCNSVGTQPVFANAGTFTKSAGTGVTGFWGQPDLGGMDVSFVNTGTVEVRTGQVAFGRVFTQSAGSLLLSGGSISALGTLDIQAGVLSGTGTVTANVQNAGVLGMGASTGILTIAGNYTQLAAGQLAIRIGGVSAGTQYDQLVVSGAAQLDGTLAVSLVNGFTPVGGTAFTVLTYGSETGALAVSGGQLYATSYGPAGLTIAPA